ncbi:MAG: sugar phosphate isomerase/epimerase [Acutalibacter sp.]|nr:sugar phosphate isomerase/epimerase [Acutalibacter sp.]
MKIGAQLYTLREYTQTAKDLDFSLGKVKGIGYETVQISAIGPIPAETVKELCDKHGLEIVLTHTDPNRILNDTEAVIKEHDVMGCKYIGIGMMPQKYCSPQWLEHFFDDFKEPAKKIAAAGKLLMYHNHNIEFQKFNGKLVMDTLLEGFSPEEMGVTLDTYWVQMGGGDVCDWLTKMKGRTPCVHLKDMAVRGWEPIMAPVMEGNLNFPKILRTIEELGGVEHLLVEQDICQGSPFDCLAISFNNLKKLGY